MCRRRRRDPALGNSHPPAGGDTGTSGSVADKIEDVKSTNGDTRKGGKGGATIVCRRQVSAAGDSRPLASCDTGRDGSATGDKVQNVPASGGKTKQIQAFGCRIRCAIDKEAEMRKYIADERSKQTNWTDIQRSVKMNAIAAKLRCHGLSSRVLTGHHVAVV